MDVAESLPFLLGTAVVIPLLSFFAILIAGPKMGKAGVGAGYVATGAIGLAAILSFAAMALWLTEHLPGESHATATSADAEHGDAEHGDAGHRDQAGAEPEDEHTPSSGRPSPDPNAETDGDDEDTPDEYTGEFTVLGIGGPWVLGQFGDLRLSVSYYIDALTVAMFCMISLIATLIHVYAMGYMHEELHDVTDHEVPLDSGEDLKRPGRYPRFFQYLSLFSFSMLGLVLAGNIALVFVFWELVGICSYFLIGFYVERKSACKAANKAFIVNRIGDFGMIIGLMALWSSLGTFSFGTIHYQDRDGAHRVQPGIFSLVQSGDLVDAPDGMVIQSSPDKVSEVVRNLGPQAGQAEIQAAIEAEVPSWRASAGGERGGPGYWLLIVAGIGIFAGCVGKSAQFPLHVWLPDAMEGPTPVSALVHSATMVAAGVYLVGRFYPAFPPEVLLVIAITGCITLFMAATIAITATDIKRVLAYSTVSQLGYMMMALGVGAWTAGMMHLITHAFFKSLLFMCSGSVIHAVHTNEMPQMGGLLKKMPVTAWTMLVGCLAIGGAGIPFIVGLLPGGHGLDGLGLSGFYSKDAILEQAFSFLGANSSAWAGIFFLAAAGGAAITSFYMFRLWYMTFAGEPRDPHRFEHAHESPPVMYVPLMVLSVMAIAVAWQPIQAVYGAFVIGVVFFVWRWTHPRSEDEASPRRRFVLADAPLGLSILVFALALLWNFTPLSATNLRTVLGQAEPFNAIAGSTAVLFDWKWPSEHLVHTSENLGKIVVPVTLMAIGTSLVGFLLATFMYALGRLNPDDVRRQFQPVYRFLLNKWWFDELYDWLFVRPAHWIAAWAAWFDRKCIDGFIDGLARVTRWLAATWEWFADQTVVDGLVNAIAAQTYAVGRWLRNVQTGRIRQYVMFIVIGALALFVLINLWKSTLAG